MIQFIKKSIYAVLELRAKKRLISNQNIKVHSDTKINTWRKFLLAEGSSLKIGKGTIIDCSIVIYHYQLTITFSTTTPFSVVTLTKYIPFACWLKSISKPSRFLKP